MPCIVESGRACGAKKMRRSPDEFSRRVSGISRVPPGPECLSVGSRRQRHLSSDASRLEAIERRKKGVSDDSLFAFRVEGEASLRRPSSRT
mmetsp:Transcript_10144/g.38488  ORF Transcript_10144/g.38488 Transcript_10144/m.38488 type:complete len:91 (+) Transcript_10144:59-331(+)|eukprot:scaffold4058_cov257-Pinguiococcus_pyrenoidosus.AAC.9